VLPEDPTGIAEPHDVLAAEEFPMPAPARSRASEIARHGRRRGKPLAAAAGLALVGLRLLRRR
jgi:hypothetical protein